MRRKMLKCLQEDHHTRKWSHEDAQHHGEEPGAGLGDGGSSARAWRSPAGADSRRSAFGGCGSCGGGGGGWVGVQKGTCVSRAIRGSGDDGRRGAGRGLVVTQTDGELVGSVRGRHIERAALRIVYVLAEVGRRYGRITGFEAELAATDEVGPVLDLDNGRVVFGRRQVVREHEATKRVTSEVGTVGVEFASTVITVEANARLVEEASNLNVSRRFDELNSGERSRGHDASTMARLGAVCYHYRFDVTDYAIRCRRAPKTEVSD